MVTLRLATLLRWPSAVAFLALLQSACGLAPDWVRRDNMNLVGRVSDLPRLPRSMSIVLSRDEADLFAGTTYVWGSSPSVSSQMVVKRRTADGSLAWRGWRPGPSDADDTHRHFLRGLALIDGKPVTVGSGGRTPYSHHSYCWESATNVVAWSDKRSDVDGVPVGGARGLISTDSGVVVFGHGHYTRGGMVVFKLDPGGDLVFETFVHLGMDLYQPLAGDFMSGALGPDGSVYVCPSAPRSPTDATFLVKISRSGAVEWKTGWAWFQGNAVVVDGAGAAYVLGDGFGPVRKVSADGYAAGNFNTAVATAVAHSDPAGWHLRAGAVLPDGDLVVTGQGRTARFTSAGALVWEYRHEGADGAALAVAPNSDVFVTGAEGGDLFLLGLASAGVPLWRTVYDGPAGLEDGGLDVAIDSAGHVYVAGFSIDQDSDEREPQVGSMVLMRFTPERE